MSNTKPDIPTPEVVATNAAPEKPVKFLPRGGALVGKKVSTPYGTGTCLGYRELDCIYEIKLLQGTGESELSSPVLYTTTVPERIHTHEDETEALNVAYEALENMRRLNLEMQCFDAGVSNVNFDHCTTCLLSNCIPSKRFPRLQKVYDDANAAQASAVSSLSKFPNMFGNKENANDSQQVGSFNPFQKITAVTNLSVGVNTKLPRIPGLWGSANRTSANEKEEDLTKETQKIEDKKPAAESKRVLPRIQNLMDTRLKQRSPPCLICANPCCPDHSSGSFRKDGISLCLSCERLFELDFIVTCVKEADPQVRAKHIDHMIDCYDRCLLLLKYSSQYIEKIATELEASKEKQNKIGLGSSSVGVLSGVLGIAAAASILTPAGPPLLIASLVFGGSATTVQVGSEAMNYLSEPNKLADRIIALHGMTLSILRVTSTLRDAMMTDYIRTDGVFEVDKSSIAEEVQRRIEKHRTGVIAGANAGRSVALGGVAISEAGAVAGAEAGVLAARAASTEASAVAAGASAGARGASAMSRASTAGTAAARGLRFARFAGGALSAAVLVMEANAIQNTLRSIQEGNPCEKAKNMRQILKDINDSAIPSTEALDRECQAYLEAISSRPTPPPVVDAEKADGTIEEFPRAECVSTSIQELSVPGAVIVDGDDTDEPSLSVATETSSSQASSRINTGSSLLERIQMHQQRRQRQSRREDEVFAVAVESEDATAAELSLMS